MIWSTYDDSKLLELWSHHYTVNAICSILGRSKNSVYKRIERLKTNKKKMTKEEFLDKVLPRTTISKEEMVKAVSGASEDSLFCDAEKCFRSMGDNSGVAAMLSSEEVSRLF